MIIFDDFLPVSLEYFDRYLLEAYGRYRATVPNPGKLDRETYKLHVALYMPDKACAGWFSLYPRVDSVRLQVIAYPRLEDGFRAASLITYFVLDMIYGLDKADFWVRNLPELIKQGGVKTETLLPFMADVVQYSIDPPKKKGKGGREPEKIYDAIKADMEAGASLPEAMKNNGLDYGKRDDREKVRKALKRRN
jgi:hypothetical protein